MDASRPQVSRKVIPALWRTVAALTLAILSAPAVPAQTIQPPFDQDYVLVDLGRVPGLPANYGGLTMRRGAPDALLIAGHANAESGAIWSVGVTRDAEGHITGFEGNATELAEAPYIDGGLCYGPGEVLFYSRYPDNEIGQVLPGSTTTDKVVDLELLGVSGSPGGVQFVPAGFPGAGRLILTTYGGASWYSASAVPDGSGTYDLEDVSHRATLSHGLEGLAFAPAGSPHLEDYGTVLINEYRAASVAAFDLDPAGDPILASRRPFVTGLPGPDGAVFDPVSGDFLISSYSLSRCYAIRGFRPPCDQDASWSNYGDGWPGTLGVPAYACGADPVLGSTFALLVDNSSGSSALGILLVGFQAASIPTTQGGTLLVVPSLSLPLLVPPPTLSLPVTLPDDPTLCGLPLFTQVLQVDAGASHGLSFTAGLNLILGR